MTVPGTTQLPGVDWILIHGQPGGIGDVLIDRSSAGEAVVDSEGRWVSPVVSFPVRAFVALVGQSEVEWARQLSVRVDAVAVLQRAAEVDESDAVTIRNVDRFLDGTYRITAVRATPVHVRVLLERMHGEPISAPVVV